MAHVWALLDYENECIEGDEWGGSEIRRLQEATIVGNDKWRDGLRFYNTCPASLSNMTHFKHLSCIGKHCWLMDKFSSVFVCDYK